MEIQCTAMLRRFAQLYHTGGHKLNRVKSRSAEEAPGDVPKQVHTLEKVPEEPVCFCSCSTQKLSL